MSIKDFQILGKLGEGAYSTVYKVKRISDDCVYALKRVKLQNLSEKEKQNALNEVRILASCHHINLTAYKEAFLEEASNSLCIVMEFADNGDLFQKIVNHQKKGQLLQEEEIWNIIIQMVKGLKPLHDMKIFHRDLKCANVFLYKDGTVKLGDMNVSKVAKKGLLYTQTGTPYYASPEVWKDQPYDHKSDIWSLGCVIYEATTLKPPFRAEDMEGLYKKVIRGMYPAIPSHYSQDLNNLIRALLQVSPQLRPSCNKILQMKSIHSRLSRQHLTELEDESNNNILLKTIRFPRSLSFLTDRLPKANYSPARTVTIDKQRFIQTLGGHEDSSRRRELNEDKLSIKGSESVDAQKKMKEKSNLPMIKGTQTPSIFQPTIQKLGEKTEANKNSLIDSKVDLLLRNVEKKMLAAKNIKENDETNSLDVQRGRERRSKEQELKEEKEKEFFLREKAREKALEYSMKGILPPSDTAKSYKSNLSKHSYLVSNLPSTTSNTTSPTEAHSEIRSINSKREINPSVNVTVIKASQSPGDGHIHYVHNGYGKDPNSPLQNTKKKSDYLSISPDLSYIEHNKKSSYSPQPRQKQELDVALKSKRSAEYLKLNEALDYSISSKSRLPLPQEETNNKSKLPKLSGVSNKVVEDNPPSIHAKQKLKSLSKAYNVNLEDGYNKKPQKKNILDGLGVHGKQMERNINLAKYGLKT